MKKILSKLRVAAMVAVVTALAFGVFAAPAYATGDCNAAEGLTGAVKNDCSQGSGQAKNLLGNGGVVTTVINTMLFIVGLLSVVMIIFAGIRYTTAHGDKQQVTSAKDTLIYAVVGLIVAIIAYAVVNWITGLWGDGSGSGGTGGATAGAAK